MHLTILNTTYNFKIHMHCLLLCVFQYVMYIYVCMYVACGNITINCPRGSQCKVDQTVHEAYCEPSCDLDNGGCTDDEVCSLQQATCIGGPCPPVVQCSSELLDIAN